MNAIEYMVSRGIDKVFGRGRYGSSLSEDQIEFKMRTALLLRPKLLVEKAVKSLDDDGSYFAADILSHSKDINYNLYNVDEFKEFITLAADSLDDERYMNSLLNGYRDHCLLAAEMIPDYRWDSLFISLYPIQKSRTYAYSPFRRILSNYAKKYSQSFEEFCKTNVFSGQKPSYATRGMIYSNFISTGLLDRKTARKIRSDASSEASVAGLKALVDNSDLYPDYDDLLLKFSDSKHEDVIMLLAKTLPDYLVPSLMGTEFHAPKRYLERRLNGEI